jgi:hypothetical protein
LSECHHDKQIVNTIFGSVKILYLDPVPSVSTIVEPSRADSNTVTSISNYISSWVVLKRFSEPLKKVDLFQMRMKAGPNGPAVLSAIADANALWSSRIARSVVKLSSYTCEGVVLEQIQEKLNKSYAPSN